VCIFLLSLSFYFFVVPFSKPSTVINEPFE
jgi:hypothetical protein